MMVGRRRCRIDRVRELGCGARSFTGLPTRRDHVCALPSTRRQEICLRTRSGASSAAAPSWSGKSTHVEPRARPPPARALLPWGLVVSAVIAALEEIAMSKPLLALVVVLVIVVALDAFFLLVGGHRNRANDARARRAPPRAKSEPRLSVRATQRNAQGAELAVDVAAHGWQAIAAVTVLAVVAAACVMLWVTR